MKKIFIIAGEESGDNLGSKLIEELKNLSPEFFFEGIGGTKMANSGLFTIFPMQEINLMGFAEIIPHIPNLIKRINQTVDKIIADKPDFLITIDSPGFNFRVVKKLRSLNYTGKIIHYVAPSVWAYKEHRAKICAELFNHMVCLFPWEPSYFEKYGLNSTFIGHPLFEDLSIISEQEKASILKDLNIKSSEKIIPILPGSRRSEIARLLPIFCDAANKIYNINSNVKFILMPTEGLRDEVAKFSHLIPNCKIVSSKELKQKLLQISSVAIVKSGTISLEVAALGCPHVVCYKINPISYIIIKKLLKIKFANLINYSAGRQVIKELLQEDCNANNISNEIIKIISNPLISEGITNDIKLELAEMGIENDVKPSKLLADLIFNKL